MKPSYAKKLYNNSKNLSFTCYEYEMMLRYKNFPNLSIIYVSLNGKFDVSCNLLDLSYKISFSL